MRMIRSTVVAVTIISCLGLPSAAADTSKTKSPKQEVEGSISVGSPLCNGSGPRWAYLAAGEGSDGIIQYEFDVDKRTWGRPFKLTITEATEILVVDLALVFYKEYGDIGSLDVQFVNFDDDREGGEAGVVPSGYNKAQILLCQSPDFSQAALNASFKYLAAGKKNPLF